MKAIWYLILIVFISLIYYRNNESTTNPTPPPEQPIINPVVNPDPPEDIILDTNIIYDDIDKAEALSKIHTRNLIIVFGADWCPYCVDLKKDAKTIKEFDKYIVCFINTDKNKNLSRKFRVRNLPTSVIIDKSGKEKSRKTGYKNKDYVKWIKEQD
jgi:thioredoxin-related protein